MVKKIHDANETIQDVKEIGFTIRIKLNEIWRKGNSNEIMIVELITF